MQCFGCGDEIRKCKTKLCGYCKKSPKVLITLHECKKRFKLTEDDINKANLFNYTYTLYGNVTTKYLIRDILELSYDLTKKLDDKDERKIAYLEQKRIIDQINMKIKNGIKVEQ